METQETSGPVFKIKKGSWHYKLINIFDSSLGIESHISLCKYFWMFIASLVKLAIVMAIALPIMAAWGLFCTIFLIGRPEITWHDIEMKYYKPWGEWFYPSFIPLSILLIGCNIEYWKYLMPPATSTLSQTMKLAQGILAVISYGSIAFVGGMMLLVAIVSVIYFFEDTATGKMVRAYFKARKDRVCPILEIED